jgi:ribonuclease HI
MTSCNLLESLPVRKHPAKFSTALHRNSTAAVEQTRALQLNQINILTGSTFQSMLVAGHGSMSNLVAYVDGGSLGNPGPSGIGVVIDGADSGTIRIAKWIGRQDNNVAEYVALLEAIQCALKLNAKTLHVYSDSQVVVRQMRGEYACRSSRLYSLNWICRKLARSFDFSISHISREHNAEANSLASSAARRRKGLKPAFDLSSLRAN